MSNVVLLLSLEGRSGGFHHWLRDLGLDKAGVGHEMPELVESGLIKPSYRVRIPKSYFLNWVNYPNCPADLASKKPNWADWSQIEWWITPEAVRKEPFWFVHPYLVPAGEGRPFLSRANQRSSRREPKPFTHSRGFDVHPYADYYFHWQAYQLVEMLSAARITWTMYSTGDVKGLVARKRRHLQFEVDYRSRLLAKVEARWKQLSHQFTLLSEYRGMREAIFLGFPGTPRKNAWNAIDRGAKRLAKLRAVSTDDWERFIKEGLLVLCRDWMDHVERGDRLYEKPLRALQHDVMLAVEWLCKLSRRKLHFYYDKWSYRHRGREEWAELKEVLPFEEYEAEREVERHCPFYLKEFNALVGPRYAFTSARVRSRLRTVFRPNPATGPLLHAFKALHDELSQDNRDGIDFRVLDPLGRYRVFAIQAELALHHAAKGIDELFDSKGNARGLGSLLKALAGRKGWPKDLLDEFDKHYMPLTQLRKMQSDPLGPIRALQFKPGTTQEHTLRSLLAFVALRNYLAHHDYSNRDVLFGTNAAFGLSSILLILLTLVDTKRREAWL